MKTKKQPKEQKPQAHRRAKGSGSLVKRGDTFTARWVVDGKVYTRSTGEGDRRKAMDKLKEYLEPFAFKKDAQKLTAIASQIEGAEAKAEALLPALSLLNSFTAYVNSPNRPDSGARTLGDYESQFNTFISWVNKNYPEITELRQITQEVAYKFAGHIGATMSANRFNKYVVFFRCFWKSMLKHPDARLKVNPWLDIQNKTVVTHSRRELTVEELTRLIEASKGEMRLLLAIGIYTGLRLSDASCLNWGSVDMVKGVIKLIPSKTARTSKKEVRIPIHKILFGLLQQCPEEKRKGYVMPNIAERYHAFNGALSKDIKDLFESVDIKTSSEGKGKRQQADCGFHSLRHTFVSLCASGGVSQSIVQELVGHGSPAMTAHYSHITMDSAKGAIATLPSIGGAGTPAQICNATQSEFEAILTKLATLTKKQLKEVVKQAQLIIKTK